MARILEEARKGYPRAVTMLRLGQAMLGAGGDLVRSDREEWVSNRGAAIAIARVSATDKSLRMCGDTDQGRSPHVWHLNGLKATKLKPLRDRSTVIIFQAVMMTETILILETLHK